MADGGGGGTGSSPPSPSSAFEVHLGRIETEIGHLRSVTQTEIGHLRSATEKTDGAVTALRKAVEDLRVDYTRLDERLRHFPTKGFIFSTAAAMLGATTAFTALIVRFLPPAS